MSHRFLCMFLVVLQVARQLQEWLLGLIVELFETFVLAQAFGILQHRGHSAVNLAAQREVLLHHLVLCLLFLPLC